ncbi:MAG TPA: hypothetical protein VGM50_01320, partial [Gemmatimonadaceae bacterium]
MPSRSKSRGSLVAVFTSLGCFAGLALVALAAPIAAQGRPLAIEDYYRIKTVGGPAISPDTRWVAFTVTTRVEATNGS